MKHSLSNTPQTQYPIQTPAQRKWTDKRFLINVVLCPALFFLLALCIITTKPEGPNLFYYSQTAVSQGEWWRMISAHFTHNTWQHFGLNMLGLGILSILFAEVASWQRWLVIFLFSSIFCSMGFFFLHGKNYAYVGMSDVLHGVVIAYALLDYKHYKWSNILLIAGTFGKVIWEQTPWYVETSGDFIGGRVAIESHFYGAISGLLIGMIFLLWEHYRNEKNK